MRQVRISTSDSTRVGEAAGSTPVKLALLALTFGTGLVDATSYLGLGRIFTANMTGNIVFLAFSMAGAPGLSAQGQLTSLICFFAGATVAGWCILRTVPGHQRARLITTAIVEGALLMIAAIVATDFVMRIIGSKARTYSVIVLTAAAMGWRTAVVRKLAVPDMITTVLTLTLTGVAAEGRLAGGDSPRLRRRLGSLVLMFSGAFTGAMLLKLGLAAPLATSAGCAFLAAAAYAALTRPARIQET